MSTEDSFISVTEARELAVRAHADQRDRDGSFHIGHVARVAEAVPADDAHQRVAWLHDVIEDSDLTGEDLGARLPAGEFQALCLLTHGDPEEPYDNYLRRIIAAPGAAGGLARTIKQADMLDNLRRCARDRDPAVAHVPLIQTVFVDWHAEMYRRHVCGRRRRKLGTHRCHFKAFDQRVIAMTLQELEPERIEQDQGDALVTVDAASHLGRDVGEVLRAGYCCRSLLRGLARTSG